MPAKHPPPAIVWFRDDLRVADNPALHAAAAGGQPLICLYVLDDASPGLRPLGGASRWWLHGALAALGERLDALGGRLDLFHGAAGDILPALCDATGATACFWNRRYPAPARALDEALAERLAAAGVAVHDFNGLLLHEPGEVRTKAGTSFHVFSPYLRAALALGFGRKPLPTPDTLRTAPKPATPRPVELKSLDLLPTKPDWADGLREAWRPGEAAAQARLSAFLDEGLSRYATDRNSPALQGSSRLSPSLRFGEVSPRQVVFQARAAAPKGGAAAEQAEKFIAEVVWRDYNYGLLAEHPDLATTAVTPAFRQFPYVKKDEARLQAWRLGQTGYPIVDAGMRQLWQTGTMHNRVRMIAGSFLVKDLLLDWRLGEEWFWDTLCDADPASNPANWQWVAGCGVDASPFFRIFNPVTQGERFDPEGSYVRRFVPELARMPARWIHKPWTAPARVLAEAGVALGTDYPKPIVDHDAARTRALAALQTVREAARAARASAVETEA